jgi:nucleoside-diphosphate-sugar epimerase
MSLRTAYENATVLVTGVTGFIGDVLLRSLLRLPVRRVYALTRSPVAFGDPRVVNLVGDVTRPAFGLDGAGLRHLAEVELFIHLAAHTRWDGTLRDQVMRNSVPMLHACELARDWMPRLRRMFLPSSFWAAAHWPAHGLVPEEILPSPTAIAPENELDLVLHAPAATVAVYQRSIDTRWPAHYAYAKALGERLVAARHADLPVVIGRIASTCFASRFPFAGFGTATSSYPAFARAVLSGRARVLVQPDSTVVLDNIPVDVCAHLILAHVGLELPEAPASGPRVIHCTSSRTNPTPWSLLMGTLLEAYAKLGGRADGLRAVATLEEALAQLRPHLAAGEKWAAVNATVLRAYDFAFRVDHVFDDRRCRAVLDHMTDEDRAVFNADVAEVDWHATLMEMYRAIHASFAAPASLAS